jgi:crotonobetainyl-CoA:carnitine CoA-transferase CaiB-like acyl-CoA transferase
MPHVPASTPLARIRVLDLSRVRAGPTCVKQFADFGADVIKIESVEPDLMNGPRHGHDMQNLHRNKRALALNLKSPEGREIFLQLVRKSDVVVENFRPDVKARLGIGYESLRAVNRRIILASISGFGQDGPYALRPGFDQIAQGMGGFMSVTGAPGGGPMRAGAAIADLAAGLFAALGIFTALVERENSGEGQWVQSNLLMSQIALMDFQAARYLVEGHVPKQVGNDHPTFMPTSAYATKDGWVNISAAGQEIWERLAHALGHPEWIARTDFEDAAARSANRVALNAAIADVTATRTSGEWVDLLNEAGVPTGPIYSVDQVFADPQVQHIRAAVPVPHPTMGEVRVINQPVTLSRTPAAIALPTPEHGQHTDEILRELGLDDGAIDGLRKRGVIPGSDDGR